jgi:hypothetical protein
MPMFKRADAEIHYEVHGQGFPLLLYAPGGLRSQLAYWKASPADPTQPAAWMNPMIALADRCLNNEDRSFAARRAMGFLALALPWRIFLGCHFLYLAREALSIPINSRLIQRIKRRVCPATGWVWSPRHSSARRQLEPRGDDHERGFKARRLGERPDQRRSRNGIYFGMAYRDTDTDSDSASDFPVARP